MIEAKNRTQGRRADDGGMWPHGLNIQDPQHQQLLLRLGRNICPFSTIDAVEHAKNIASVVVAGRARR